MADTEEPKKPSSTNKSMNKDAAPSSTQPNQGTPADNKEVEEVKGELKEITKKLDKIADIEEKNAEEIVESTKDVKNEIASGKPTPEEKNEQKRTFKEAFAKLGESMKSAFGGLKKGFESLKDDFKEFGGLKGLKDVFMKIKNFLLLLGLGVLLKGLSVSDVKKMWEGFKETMLSMKKMFIAMMDFLDPIWQWWTKENGGFDKSVEFFKKSFEGLATMFDEIRIAFDGFTEKGFKGRMTAILKSFEAIGKFMQSFFGDIFDMVFQAFGYKGSVTTDIRNFLENTFGPDVRDSMQTLFRTILGAMAVARILGMSPGKYMVSIGTTMFNGLWKFTKWMVSWSLGMLMRIPGMAALVMAAAPVLAATGITAAVVLFADKITYGFEAMLNWISDQIEKLWVASKNKIADTKFGKFLGLEKAEFKGSENREKENRLAQMKRLRELQAKEAEGKIKHNSKEFHQLKALRGNLFNLSQSRADTFSASDLAELKGQEWYAGEKGKHLDPEKMRGWVMEKMGFSGESFKQNADGSIELSEMSVMAPKMTEKFEGFESFAYDDKIGKNDDGSPVRTIGYGFNLDKPNAADILKKAGISKSFTDLYEGTVGLTKQEARKLKSSEMAYFRKTAEMYVGTATWNKMNVGGKAALTDMAYNMGGRFTGKNKDGTFKWKDLRSALQSGNVSAIRPAMEDSQWFKQVQSDRSEYNIASLEGAFVKPSAAQSYDFASLPSRMEEQKSIMNQTINNTDNGDKVNYGAGDSARRGMDYNPLENKMVRT